MNINYWKYWAYQQFVPDLPGSTQLVTSIHLLGCWEVNECSAWCHQHPPDSTPRGGSQSKLWENTFPRVPLGWPLLLPREHNPFALWTPWPTHPHPSPQPHSLLHFPISVPAISCRTCCISHRPERHYCFSVWNLTPQPRTVGRGSRALNPNRMPLAICK